MQTQPLVKYSAGYPSCRSVRQEDAMSRVERDSRQQKREADERERAGQREPVDRTPSKAEGDEQTVDEALRREEER